MEINLAKIKKIHFVGIKGVAMAALAIIAQEMGKQVTGSDVAEKFPTDKLLARRKIDYHVGFKPKHVRSDVDLVVYTGAHQGRYNKEVVQAKNLGIPVLPHGRALGWFISGKRVISVAGSHGKTTTSAMMAEVLVKAGWDPGFAVGCGEINNLKTSAHFGKGDWFVVEADEYATDIYSDHTPRFAWQKPEQLIITNIDFDHPDVYQNLGQIKQAFRSFITQVIDDGVVIVNQDDSDSLEVVWRQQQNIVSYGESNQADFQVRDMEFLSGKMKFKIFYRTKKIGNFQLLIPGKHNVLNATAVVAASKILGIDMKTIRDSLAEFRGTKRRLELIDKKNGKLLYDDYAHHPAEIRATLTAIKAWYPKKRLVVIFQPHTFSRTAALLADFATSFTNAEVVLLCDIYASAREQMTKMISGRSLCLEVKKHQRQVYYTPDKQTVLEYIEQNTQKGDLIVTMGAGDIYSWLPEIKAVL